MTATQSARRLLDHLAIRVADREAATAELLDRFDVRVIENTDRFTLVGPDFEHGKITLLDAQDGDPPVARRIVSVVFAESASATVQPPVQLDSGIVVTFASVDDLGPEWEPLPRHALVGVTLRCDDPTVAAAALASQHGMHVESARPDVAIVQVDGPGTGRIALIRERWDGPVGPPMLDHIGVRVADADRWRDEARSRDAEIVRWVDAEHSRAVFVAGPEQLLIEFVEHTVPIGAV